MRHPGLACLNGLPLWVCRSSLGDCTNGGVTSNHDRLTLVAIARRGELAGYVEGPFQPSERSPAVVLDEHVPGCLRLVPLELFGERHSMMGGNFAETSDSRFREACERLLGHRFYGAVAVHDRVESAAEQRMGD